jgi:hypothetical protein
MTETREEREARKGGENEVRGSIDAQRALQKKQPLKPTKRMTGRKQKR